MRIEWDGSLETGDAVVDDQHKTLIGLFNDVCALAANGETEYHVVGDALIRLSDYVSTHFAAEEELMVRYEYPEDRIAHHVAQHEDLSGRARDMVLAHRRGELPSLMPLVTLLHEWLTEHITRVDQMLVDHIRESSESAQAS